MPKPGWKFQLPTIQILRNRQQLALESGYHDTVFNKQEKGLVPLIS